MLAGYIEAVGAMKLCHARLKMASTELPLANTEVPTLAPEVVLARAEELLAAAPHWHIRCARVERSSGARPRFHPHAWGSLPTPQVDYDPPRGRYWITDGWKCAALANTLRHWWGAGSLRELLAENEPDHHLRVFEVPLHQAHNCGTQVVFNPRVATCIADWKLT